MGARTAKPILRCDRAGCIEPAKYQIGFKLWAAGYPQRETNCLRALTGLCVCEQHRADSRADDLLTTEGKEMIGNAILAAGKALPDFASAQLEFMPVFDNTPMSPELFAMGARG